MQDQFSLIAARSIVWAQQRLGSPAYATRCLAFVEDAVERPNDRIHAWDRVRIDPHRDVERLSPAPGWSAPRWWGWVPLGDVLKTARPRVWGADETPEATTERQQTEVLRGEEGREAPQARDA